MKHAELIAEMTLSEKCTLLSGADMRHTRAIRRLNIPAITFSEDFGGLRKQTVCCPGLSDAIPATCMPSPSSLANSWNEFLAQAVGKAVGQEAAAQDIQVLIGPNIHIKRSPLCGSSSNDFSEDPYLSGKMAAAFIQGVQSCGVAACVKPFAADNQADRQMTCDSVLDERTLRELYLTGFEIAVKEGAPRALMTGCNRVNGLYAGEHPHLLDDILRGEWQYSGAVITGWGGGNNIAESVRAGCGLEMPGCGDDSAVQLISAVRAGEISENVIDARVDELLELILNTDKPHSVMPCDFEHNHQLARRAAEESIVLLKNEHDVLPLAKSTRVAVIGDFAKNPRFHGAGSSGFNAAMADKTLELLPEYFRHAVGYAQGFRRSGKADKALAAQAEALAAQSEVVILYLGLPEGFETEGLDRTHMRIPENQIHLLERIRQVNPHIVVVMTAGCAVEMPWLDQCEALLWAGLGGQAIASAVLRVLVGDVNPSGKLTETFPLTYGDLPVSRYYPEAEQTSEYRESLYVGYRYTETAGIPVRFPFGFGLSYTTFAYSNLKLSPTAAEFDLTNTGKCIGAEVAQLYVFLPRAEIFRPKMELKGFCKMVLYPGETRHVVLPLDDKAFRYFNTKTNRWEIEGGAYQIHIAAHARDIRLTGTLHIQGTDAPNPYADKALACYEQGRLHDIPDAQFSALLGRPIPPHLWDKAAPLTLSDSVMQLSYAKNPLARYICKSLTKKINASLAAGVPDLTLLFIYRLSFRGMAKMSGGRFSTEMAQGLVEMVNGHSFRGFCKLARGFFHRPKLSRYD